MGPYSVNLDEYFETSKVLKIRFLFQIGPVFLPARLTETIYLNFLQNELFGRGDPLNLWDNVDLARRQNHIFMQDEAPPHFAAAASHCLDAEYGQNWMGRLGPIGWPARSPDLNPLDYFLWGYVKSVVYAEDTLVREECRQKIIQTFESIDPGMIQRATNDIRRRLRLCQEF